MLILRAGQLRALVKHASRLEGKNIISNRTDLICSSNKYFNNYDMCVRSFGQTNQLTQDARVQIKYLTFMLVSVKSECETETGV